MNISFDWFQPQEHFSSMSFNQIFDIFLQIIQKLRQNIKYIYFNISGQLTELTLLNISESIFQNSDVSLLINQILEILSPQPLNPASSWKIKLELILFQLKSIQDQLKRQSILEVKINQPLNSIILNLIEALAEGSKALQEITPLRNVAIQICQTISSSNFQKQNHIIPLPDILLSLWNSLKASDKKKKKQPNDSSFKHPLITYQEIDLILSNVNEIAKIVLPTQPETSVCNILEEIMEALRNFYLKLSASLQQNGIFIPLTDISLSNVINLVINFLSSIPKQLHSTFPNLILSQSYSPTMTFFEHACQKIEQLEKTNQILTNELQQLQGRFQEYTDFQFDQYPESQKTKWQLKQLSGCYSQHTEIPNSEKHFHALPNTKKASISHNSQLYQMKINQITSEIKDLELAIHQSMFKVYRLQNQLINLNKRDIYSQYETGIFRNAYQRLQTKIKRLEAEKQTLFSCFPQYELDFNEFQDEYNEFDVSDHYLQFQLQQSNKSISVLHMKLDNFRKKNRSLSADIQKLQKSTEGLK